MPIQLKNIKKSFVNNKIPYNVLNNISLDINDNELISIMGRSGAGKSTLLNIIGCIDNCDEGDYILDGLNINNLNNSELSKIRNKKFGFIMQDFALIEDETVRRNIMLPTYFSKSKKIYECEKIAKELGIYKLLEKKASLLSGGEKQRTAIARALINDPKYIIADEPTGALDSATADLIMNIIIELNKSGKTIIIVTHDEEIAKKCKRILYISDGEITG